MIHSKKEIAEFQKKYELELRKLKNDNGEPLLDEDTIHAYAYGIGMKAIDDMMQYHTPEELALFYTM